MAGLYVFLTALSLVTAEPMQSSNPTIRGQYLEARTCDVYTGSCFANADTGLTGRNAVLAWKIEQGSYRGCNLDGLAVAVVLAASDTLGLKQSAPAKAVVIVDTAANAEQRQALVAFVRAQTGNLIGEIVAVRSAPVQLSQCPCDNGACARLTADNVQVATRCIYPEHDKACGNESVQYPPLARGVQAVAAMTVEHSYTGKELNQTWQDAGRRGAFVGRFSSR
ncbi:MAG: DUF1326 domain-containing protein [Gemmataceae bacterium]|nr:DUF1326 domain-containing protein [Gemmataceae bacterium]MCS7269457.1 DUF1326 domain-containing protein [Gemmataceae bacterium]MDW8241636.1 DUF1326 domain-containing protein [Thermogemmata sp.]